MFGEYYIMTKPFGIGSRVTVKATNLTLKGAVKKFKAMGYNVTEEDVKPTPCVRPCKCISFHIPTFSAEQLENAKKYGAAFIEPCYAKAWNTTPDKASNDCKKAEAILKKADIDCRMFVNTIDIYLDTNTPEGVEFAEFVCETLRAPKKELK